MYEPGVDGEGKQMKTLPQRMPNLSNYTAGAIVDECAPVQEEYNRLDKLTKYYKTGLKARLRDDMKTDPFTYLIKGAKYSATVSIGQQVRVDMEKVRNLLTQEQIDDCMKVIDTQTVRFYKNEEETK